MNAPLDLRTADELTAYMTAVGRRARAAAALMAKSSTAVRNSSLLAIAAAIRARHDEIRAANQRDVDRARAGGLAPAMLDRLLLSDEYIEKMAGGLEQLAAMPDPIGTISDVRPMPSGIEVGRMRVPLGVIGIIYESRPNVTIDAAGLCIKSGNATILRGGSEAIECNRLLAALITDALNAMALPADAVHAATLPADAVHAATLLADAVHAATLPADAVQLIDTTDRAAVGLLATMPEYVDIIVPRGGKGLIERLMRESKVPMIKHLDGICHVYIDAAADMDKAIRIADNAKTQRYGTCNTMETLLVAAAIAPRVLPPLGRLYAGKGVELRGCAQSHALLQAAGVACMAATEEDWRTEYLAPILAIRVVDGVDAAIEHINTFSSHHTDAIVTEDHSAAMRFLREVDSASVLINASTRFADGFEYGLGAEIGISNDKLHARGPVGLEGLTSLKFVVFGHGEIRQ